MRQENSTAGSDVTNPMDPHDFINSKCFDNIKSFDLIDQVVKCDTQKIVLHFLYL